MPSALTHAFVGGAISTFAPRRFRGVKLGVVLAVAAALPDLDVLAFRVGIPYAHPLGHRGLSHSLPFAVLFAIVLWTWLGRDAVRLSRASEGLFLVIFVACASHGFLDAFTDAGLGVGFFIPFSDVRYFFPWRPILTSPLSIGRFFSEDGALILRNEAVWVWIPVGLVVVLTVLARHMVHGSTPLHPMRAAQPNEQAKPSGSGPRG